MLKTSHSDVSEQDKVVKDHRHGQKSLDDILTDVREHICKSCNVNSALILKTISYPYVLHIINAPPLKNWQSHTPSFLQRDIVLNNKIYDIVGAVYEDDTHEIACQEFLLLRHLWSLATAPTSEFFNAAAFRSVASVFRAFKISGRAVFRPPTVYEDFDVE